MTNERSTEGPPYGILLAAVVVVVIGIPKFIGGGGGAMLEFIAKLRSPYGLLLVSIILLLVILYLLRPFVAGILSDPNSIHRASGSPVGVALVLVLMIFLLYSKFSIFGDDDNPEEWL